MKITYWSDYECPYCYIGEARLKKALASYPELSGTEIEMKAFRLDPSAPAHEEETTRTRFARKYGLSLASADRHIDSATAMAESEGLVFHYGTTLFTNTMDAHRLTKFAARTGGSAKAEQIAEELFKAYFTDNKELADRNVLTCAAKRCGLDPDETERFLESGELREEVLSDEREAAEMGIRGVPYFMIGRYAVSGAQSTETFRRALGEALKEEERL